MALHNQIRPIVEMFPVEAVFSKQGEKWEPLPTWRMNSRDQSLREHLESTLGLFMFYDSVGCVIFAGASGRFGIWNEMTHIINHESLCTNHKTFLVDHPTTGSIFTPAWKSPHHPQKRTVYLHDRAHYFSAYEVAPELIENLEALVTRAFCNSLSNKRMGKFPQSAGDEG